MRFIIVLNCILISNSILGQSELLSEKDTILDLVGVWKLTEFEHPHNFEDTWEFKLDGSFNELKYKTEGGDGKMIPDGNGSWNLRANELKMTITGEYMNGRTVVYKRPVIWKFQIEPFNGEYKLNMIFDSNLNSQVGSVLRLTRK